MKLNRWLLVSLVILVGVSSYLGGYRRAQARSREAAIRGQLLFNLHMRRAAERGDTDRIKRDLGLAIWGATREYEAHFGRPSGTNTFARQFVEAQKITVETGPNLVPLSSLENAIKGTTN
jgi:hypothetical protein